MSVHIALLRGINVGGRAQVAMSDLRGLLTALGLADVRSLLQSGNLIFRSHGRTGADLERLLQAEGEKRLDLRTEFLVRTAKEWQTVVDRNPFPDEVERNLSHLVVMFLKGAPALKDVEALRTAIKGPEIVCTDGRQAYIVYPNGIGRSKLTNTLIEDRLVTRGTGRNWNTVLKIAALVRT
jgi:uncharacterized protein (DUF1697 family)